MVTPTAAPILLSLLVLEGSWLAFGSVLMYVDLFIDVDVGMDVNVGVDMDFDDADLGFDLDFDVDDGEEPASDCDEVDEESNTEVDPSIAKDVVAASVIESAEEEPIDSAVGSEKLEGMRLGGMILEGE